MGKTSTVMGSNVRIWRIVCMEDSDQEGEGCFDEIYDREDCESESEVDAYMEDDGHEDDLDYMEVC